MRPGSESKRGMVDGPIVEAVFEAIRSIRFGSVEVVIHDGRIVGIERREKVRIERHPIR